MTTTINKSEAKLLAQKCSVHRPAIFISKQGAARALIEVAREYGLTGAVLASKGRIVPRTVRWGYCGLYRPVSAP